MKQLPVFLLLFLLSFNLHAQEKDKKAQTPTLRSVLLEQLRSTHNQKDWFVPANTAAASNSVSDSGSPSIRKT